MEIRTISKTKKHSLAYNLNLCVLALGKLIVLFLGLSVLDICLVAFIVEWFF